MCCVAVLIQPNNIWTRSSDGRTTVLAEAQLTPGKKNNARKWMQQLTDLTFMYQRIRSSIKSLTLTLDFLVIPEPLDSGSRFTACCRACQRDYVTLHGRLGESCDFWSSWNSCIFRRIVFLKNKKTSKHRHFDLALMPSQITEKQTESHHLT